MFFNLRLSFLCAILSFVVNIAIYGIFLLAVKAAAITFFVVLVYVMLYDWVISAKSK